MVYAYAHVNLQNVHSTSDFGCVEKEKKTCISKTLLSFLLSTKRCFRTAFKRSMVDAFLCKHNPRHEAFFFLVRIIPRCNDSPCLRFFTMAGVLYYCFALTLQHVPHDLCKHCVGLAHANVNSIQCKQQEVRGDREMELDESTRGKREEEKKTHTTT